MEFQIGKEKNPLFGLYISGYKKYIAVWLICVVYCDADANIVFMSIADLCGWSILRIWLLLLWKTST